MEKIIQKKTNSGAVIHMINPYTKIRSFLQKKKMMKREKLLQMKLAILSGGITKVK